MICTSEEHDGYSLIRIEGMIENANMLDVKTVFEKAIERGANLIIDISAVTFISSSGLGLIFNSNARLKSIGKKLILSSPSEEIRKLFSITRIENHILRTDSVSDALILLK